MSFILGLLIGAAGLYFLYAFYGKEGFDAIGSKIFGSIEKRIQEEKHRKELQELELLKFKVEQEEKEVERKEREALIKKIKFSKDYDSLIQTLDDEYHTKISDLAAIKDKVFEVVNAEAATNLRKKNGDRKESSDTYNRDQKTRAKDKDTAARKRRNALDELRKQTDTVNRDHRTKINEIDRAFNKNYKEHQTRNNQIIREYNKANGLISGQKEKASTTYNNEATKVKNSYQKRIDVLRENKAAEVEKKLPALLKKKATPKTVKVEA